MVSRGARQSVAGGPKLYFHRTVFMVKFSEKRVAVSSLLQEQQQRHWRREGDASSAQQLLLPHLNGADVRAGDGGHGPHLRQRVHRALVGTGAQDVPSHRAAPEAPRTCAQLCAAERDTGQPVEPAKDAEDLTDVLLYHAILVAVFVEGCAHARTSCELPFIAVQGTVTMWFSAMVPKRRPV